ncbi:MAG: hypothetical protein GX125_02705 [Bacteroidales bacterium]|jgi:hypothetical protein|nr:hypothetical protein [Bacteroidales bacterium]
MACNSIPQKLPAPLSKALEELDASIASRPEQEYRKQERINALKSSFQIARSYQDRFALARNLVEEYSPYNFDSTLAWIGICRSVAQKANRPNGIAWTTIKQGEILANAGYYTESYYVLSEQVDSTALPDYLLPDYYYSLYRLADNIVENSLGCEGNLHLDNPQTYMEKLLQLYPEDSYDWKYMHISLLASQQQFEKARIENAALLGSIDKKSHPYAKSAWVESVLCDSLGLESEKILWEVTSAKADFINVVKDYASLTLVAKDLIDIDIDRSFRYIQMALEDAVFYNAKLRPWKISHYLIRIQRAYEQTVLKNSRWLKVFTLCLTLLAPLLIASVILLAKMMRSATRSKKDLNRLNNHLTEAYSELQRANADLSEANSIKEQYIGLFLSQLSENINKIKAIESNVIKQLRYGKVDQLLKEMIASTTVEEEIDAFYDSFDTSFLAIFPNFVEQFNSLLEESSKIVLKKGEKLNTELRIFALIRLGIEDSNTIADLLKYSVRTIYNYKVKIRKAARIPREKFNKKIHEIG